MNLRELNTVYFIGVGGIGMSALARFFHKRGAEVAGYDKTATPLTKQLEQEGINVHYNDAVEQLPGSIDLVVYTPAIPKTHSELNYLKASGIPMMKRSEVLGLITQNMNALAVAGTHGKTTTSSMVAHILKSTIGTNAFVGGLMTNYNSNFIWDTNSENVVVEADEFDRSFLTLFPNKAVITSMDADHLDIYGEASQLEKSFTDFAAQVGEELLVKTGLNVESKTAKVLRYAIDETADYKATNVSIANGKYQFDIEYPGGEIGAINLGLAGRHNVENAIAAFGLAHLSGIETEAIKEALESYRGVKRRFEYIVEDEENVYIDDYAHHPKELEMAISSARELFPGKKLTGVFQPHLFTRTRDFENEFAEALSTLDELILLDIYPARELPIEGVTSANLLKKISIENKELLSKQEVVDRIKKERPEVLMTLGAGDIDQLVEPIKKQLLAN